MIDSITRGNRLRAGSGSHRYDIVFISDHAKIPQNPHLSLRKIGASSTTRVGITVAEEGSVKSVLTLALVLVGSLTAAACSDAPLFGGSKGKGDDSGEEEKKPAPDYENPRTKESEELPDALEGLPKGRAQLDALCARGERNPVTQALCNGQSVTSLVELQEALNLGFEDKTARGQNASGGNPGFAILGHSTSLVARSVSAINPRTFVFPATPGRPVRINGWAIIGFARGEPFVEIAAEDPNTKKITFYLLKFDLACEATHSCKPGDLLTPDVEKNWQGFSLYDDEDLKNTIVDCRHCHQPDATGKKLLRMQELRDPWTHWFRNDRPGGIALMGDFLRAHGDKEDYGGVPATLIQRADGRALEDFVVGQGFQQQPNAFDSQRIENEVRSSSRAQPDINTPRGSSSTWQSLYDRSLAGEFIPVPYHDVKVTGPDELQFATDAYRAFLAGTMPKAELPDVRRVLLEEALEELVFRPKKGATGREVLVSTCAQCHNPRLDQSISRAGFDVTKLDSMPRAMKDKAISRMTLPAKDKGHMPPALCRTLPDDALKAALEELAR